MEIEVRSNPRRILILAMLYSLPACLAINSVVLKESIKNNSDLWWHLSTGAWIVQHHAVPATEPFSAVGRNRPWVAYSWLFELILYAFYRWKGLVGTVVYIVPVLVGLAVALHAAIRKRMGGFAAPVAMAALGLFAIARIYTTRPWLFTILFFTIEVDILFGVLIDEPNRHARRRLWLLPLLFALWANLHIQFIYGLAILGLAVVTQDLNLTRGQMGFRISRATNEHRWELWVVTGLSALATLLNPYSWRVYQVILDYATERVPFGVVTELLPPNFRSPFDYIMIALALCAAIVLGRSFLLGRGGLRRGNIFAGLLLVSSTLFSLRTIRDGWMVIIVALLTIAAPNDTREPLSMPLPRLQRLATAAVAVVLILLTGNARGLSNANLENQVASVFPVQAANMVAQSRFSGPLLNDFEWGGYLIWSLPGLPVSMDGRTNVYGDERIARSVATFNCMEGWQTDPELTSANLVVVQVGDCLSSALQADPKFGLVYRDATAVVFVRRDALGTSPSSSQQATGVSSP